MIKELKKLRTEAVSKEELSRAINMTRASLFLNCGYPSTLGDGCDENIVVHNVRIPAEAQCCTCKMLSRSIFVCKFGSKGAPLCGICWLMGTPISRNFWAVL